MGYDDRLVYLLAMHKEEIFNGFDHSKNANDNPLLSALRQEPVTDELFTYVWWRVTLKHNPAIMPSLPDFHFGINVDLTEFDRLSDKILKTNRHYVTKEPEIWDENTPIERKKMYTQIPWLPEKSIWQEIPRRFMIEEW